MAHPATHPAVTEGFCVAGDLYVSKEDRTVRLKLHASESVIGISQLKDLIGTEPVLAMFASIDPVHGKDEIDIVLTLPEK